jgi:O-antigen/teichoic acid export membrane protein
MHIARLRNYFSSKSIAGSSVNLLISQIVVSITFLASDYWISHHHIELFATWKQLQLVLSLVLPLLSFGIPEAYKYYSAKEPSKSNFHLQFTLNALLLLSTFWLPIFYFIFPIASYQFFHHIDFRYCAFALIFLFFSLNINRVLRYESINTKTTNRFLIVSCISILSVLTGFYLDHIILYNFPISVRIAVICFVIGLFYIIPSLLLGTLNFRNFNLVYSKSTFFAYFKIGFPLYIASFISIIVSNIDKAWLGHFYDKSTFAIYAAGALEIPLFAMLSAAFSQSTFPEYVRLLSANLHQEAKELWITITRKVSYITYPVLLLSMLFAKTLFSAIYGPSLLQGLIIFKTFLLIALWRNNYYGALINASGKSKWISFYSALNLCLVLIGIVVVNTYFTIYELPWVLLLSTSTLATLQMAHEKMLKIYLTKFLLKPFTLILIIAILVVYLYSPL